MKKTAYLLAALLGMTLQSRAIDKNTVEIVYNGTTATVTVASNIASYVTVGSGTSAHVVITQSESFAGVDKTTDNEDGEIYYVLKGQSTDGEFKITGSYKCEVDLEGLTLTNPAGPALNIQNGKRITISAKNGTTNTLTDGANDDFNGCIHVKGHTKMKGKGTLNVVGKSKHAIYSKEYLEIKNITLNVTAAQKDGIHCKEYFLMESGTVSISGVGDDGIQCELEGTTSTGKTAEHEEEDSGNFYMLKGTLTISNYGGKAIKTDGTITYSGGKQNFDTADTLINSINTLTAGTNAGKVAVYDLSGRAVSNTKANGVYIVNKEGRTYKAIAR